MIFKHCMLNLLVLIGLITLLLAVFWDHLFKSILYSSLVLTPTSYIYPTWETLPVPIIFEVYMFNCTNCFEVEKNWTIKPILQECGPYVYEERHRKVKVRWNGNGTVSFKQIREWYYRPEYSNGTMNDQIISLNLIPITIGYVLRDKIGTVRRAANYILKTAGETLIVKKSVHELIFDGYRDKVLAFLEKIGVKLVVTDRFAWFILRNGSDVFDGNFTMNTGEGDVNKFGLLDSWNGVDMIPYYSGECASIKTSSIGELFPANAENGVSIFVPDICSNLQMIRTDATVLDGISVDEYNPRDDIFDQSYCKDNEGIKLLPGVRSISSCKIAPAFISFPHFFAADKWYSDAFTGLNPNPEKHRMRLFLDPVTKVPVFAKAQLQINILLRPIDKMNIFEDVPVVYFPMIWFRQTAVVPYNYRKLLKVGGFVYTYLGYVFYGCAVVCFLAIIYHIYSQKRVNYLNSINNNG